MQKISTYFLQHPMQQKVLFITVSLLCVTPFISAPIALVLGFIMIQFVGNPYEETTKN
jgi:hypothetical protein